MNLNKVLIIGNLTRDPEFRTTPTGQNVCSFSIATSRRWKDQASGEMKEQTEFHNIIAWGRLAETCNQYLRKASKVYVEGRIQYRQWEDQTGQKKNRTEIVCESMIMLDKKGVLPAGRQDTPARPAAPEAAAASTPEPTHDTPADDVRVEDIPF